MILYQLIEMKRNINREISELKKCLYEEVSEQKLKELFLLFNKRKDCSLLIHKFNNDCCIDINGEIVSLEDAICIRDILKCKIDFFTDLIDNKNKLYFSLNEQRKSMLLEYELLKILILEKDLETEV